MKVKSAGVKWQDLGYRWGSCSKGDWLYVWMAILLPARIAEYVVAHEVAHRYEPHHTPAFSLCVARDAGFRAAQGLAGRARNQCLTGWNRLCLAPENLPPARFPSR